jgi:hypothetical protein
MQAMPTLVIGAFLAAHGLITTMIGVTAVTSPGGPAMRLPAWFDWWPGPFGRSWLIDALNLGTGAAVLGGLLWIVAGIALIGAGLGYLGFGPLQGQWELLGLVGGGLGLLVVAAYFHPLYAVAVLINLVLVIALWGRLGLAN